MSELFNWQIGGGIAIISIILGYLLGSIPFGLLLTRMAGLGDIRSIGSGNIGATNVLRTGNRKLAATTLVLDALKATAAALIGTFAAGPQAGLLAGFAAFLGHLFPVWLGFRGGKGVATYIGVLLGVSPLWVLVFAAIWLSVAFISRYSSLSALAATLVVPVSLWVAGEDKIALIMAIMTIISWWRHETNIRKLLTGTEAKIGKKE